MKPPDADQTNVQNFGSTRPESSRAGARQPAATGPATADLHSSNAGTVRKGSDDVGDRAGQQMVVRFCLQSALLCNGGLCQKPVVVDGSVSAHVRHLLRFGALGGAAASQASSRCSRKPLHADANWMGRGRSVVLPCATKGFRLGAICRERLEWITRTAGGAPRNIGKHR